jgi:hypothetical protein
MLTYDVLLEMTLGACHTKILNGVELSNENFLNFSAFYYNITPRCQEALGIPC